MKINYLTIYLSSQHSFSKTRFIDLRKLKRQLNHIELIINKIRQRTKLNIFNLFANLIQHFNEVYLLRRYL